MTPKTTFYRVSGLTPAGVSAWSDKVRVVGDGGCFNVGNTSAREASADAQAQTFSGTIVKVKNHYVLKTDKMTYLLDDETKAKQFEGKQVNVSGTADKSTEKARTFASMSAGCAETCQEPTGSRMARTSCQGSVA